MSPEPSATACPCAQRPNWARLDDETVLEWPVVEVGEWEELRQCPACGAHWLCAWPEELENSPILCRPLPPGTHRLRDVNRPESLRPYCLARIEEHLGELREEKRPCKKIDCEHRRLIGSSYCVEHLIAQRFGRHLSKLDSK